MMSGAFVRAAAKPMMMMAQSGSDTGDNESAPLRQRNKTHVAVRFKMAERVEANDTALVGCRLRRGRRHPPACPPSPARPLPARPVYSPSLLPDPAMVRRMPGRPGSPYTAPARPAFKYWSTGAPGWQQLGCHRQCTADLAKCAVLQDHLQRLRPAEAHCTWIEYLRTMDHRL